MKIGITTISTGKKYNTLCKQLLNSVYKNFIPDIEKVVFVMGNDQSILNKNEDFTYLTGLPFPLVTLLRYHFLNRIKEKLKLCDVIFYLDADLEILNPITYDEIMPEKENQFVVTKHPWAKSEDNRWVLEQNKNSSAYVENAPQYFQACFYGCYASTFITMLEKLKEETQTDLNNRIIAKWFDESHFNKYIIDKEKKILSDKYCFPKTFTGWNSDPEIKIAHYNAHVNP